MTAVCKICKETVQSLLVGLDRQKLEEEMAIVLLNHMGQKHQPYMKNLVELTRIFSGFIVMNRFTIADEGMEDEKENMRDKLAERVMQDTPGEEDFEDEDQGDIENASISTANQERAKESIEEARKRGEPQEVRRRRQKEVGTQENKEDKIEEVENQPI